MNLDPQARAFLEQLAAANPPSYPAMGVQAARQLYAARADTNMPTAEVAEVYDTNAEGRGGPLPLRVYRGIGTDSEAALPVMVYFHGGGWVVGDIETHDPICRELANIAHCAVISVAYRRSPEHKFPEPVEDAVAATLWVASNAKALRIDPTRIAVGGDSAGGALATVTAIILRDRGGPPLAMQALIYPPVDLLSDTDSHRDYAEGYGLTRDSVLWFRNQYLRDERDAYDWRASPLRAPDFRNLPPAYILTAGFDTLRDEGLLYAEALHRAGVPTTYECFEGMIHGFINIGRYMSAAHHAVYRIAQALKTVFDPPRQ